MTEKLQTAQVRQFPIKPRNSRTAVPTQVPDLVETPAVQAADFGSGWYHEAAMREASEARHR